MSAIETLEIQARQTNQLTYAGFKKIFFDGIFTLESLALEFYEDYVSSQMSIDTFIAMENF